MASFRWPEENLTLNLLSVTDLKSERLSKYTLIDNDFENKKELKGFDPTCPSSSALRRNIRRLKTKRLILANTSVHDSLNPIRNCVFFHYLLSSRFGNWIMIFLENPMKLYAHATKQSNEVEIHLSGACCTYKWRNIQHNMHIKGVPKKYTYRTKS